MNLDLKVEYALELHDFGSLIHLKAMGF